MRKIKEGPAGSSRQPAENIVPSGAKKLPFSTGSYDFFAHKKGRKITLYIQTTDYHAGILEIPLLKLQELVKYLKRMK
jgi:hypothetical protein